MKHAILASVLVALFAVSGCTTTEYITIEPQCSPVPSPSFPEIDRGELWDSLGDEDYRSLERYIDTLWGYADENAAIVAEVCKE